MTDDGWTGWNWVIGDKIDWNGWKWLQKGHWMKWMNMDYCNNMEKLLLPSWWVLKVAELIYRHLHWFDIKVWPHFDQLVRFDSHKRNQRVFQNPDFFAWIDYWVDENKGWIYHYTLCNQLYLNVQGALGGGLPGWCMAPKERRWRPLGSL